MTTEKVLCAVIILLTIIIAYFCSQLDKDLSSLHIPLSVSEEMELSRLFRKHGIISTDIVYLDKGQLYYERKGKIFKLK